MQNPYLAKEVNERKYSRHSISSHVKNMKPSKLDHKLTQYVHNRINYLCSRRERCISSRKQLLVQHLISSHHKRNHM
ncbi:hypothetical protein VNO80_16793 [Phaseolus coccineus]|uniref:Uncharacterized protein n=1 Tax=Phaseolus coccineus TaxID=3886 RepID=A0AAN9MMP3_PHACN